MLSKLLIFEQQSCLNSFVVSPLGQNWAAHWARQVLGQVEGRATVSGVNSTDLHAPIYLERQWQNLPTSRSPTTRYGWLSQLLLSLTFYQGSSAQCVEEIQSVASQVLHP